MLGIGREQLRLIESDNNFRLNIAALRERVESDRNDGLKPFCVVGSAGTVNTGAIDSLAEIAEVAREFDLWFHVDGAYGALGALDESKRPLFRASSLPTRFRSIPTNGFMRRSIQAASYFETLLPRARRSQRTKRTTLGL